MQDAAEEKATALIECRVVRGVQFIRRETAAKREVWKTAGLAQTVYVEPEQNPSRPFRVAGGVYASFEEAARNAIRIRKREVEFARKLVEDYDRARFMQF